MKKKFQLSLAILMALVALGAFTWMLSAEESISPPYVIVLRPWSDNARAVGVDPVRGYAYVVAEKGIAVFYELSRTATIDVNNPQQVAVDPVRGYAYVTRDDEKITVLSETVALTNPVDVGASSDAIAVMKTTGYAYAALPGFDDHAGNDQVAVIQGQTLLAKVEVGDKPRAVAANSNTGYVYVVNAGSHNVSILSETTKIKDVTVGLTPTAVALNPVNGYVYVSNSNDTVSVLRGLDFITELPIQEPGEIAINTQTGRAYVISNDTSDTSDPKGWVEVVQVTSTTGIRIPMAAEGHAIDVNSESRYVYVSIGADTEGAVTIMSDTLVIESFPMGQTALDVTHNPASDLAYVPIYDGRVAIFGRTRVYYTDLLSPTSTTITELPCMNTQEGQNLPITITIPAGAIPTPNTRVLCIPLREVEGGEYAWAKQAFRLAVSIEPTGTNPPDYAFNYPLTVTTGYLNMLPGNIKEEELEVLRRVWDGVQDEWQWQHHGIDLVARAPVENLITVNLDYTGEYALVWGARVYLPVVMKGRK